MNRDDGIAGGIYDKKEKGGGFHQSHSFSSEMRAFQQVNGGPVEKEVFDLSFRLFMFMNMKVLGWVD